MESGVRSVSAAWYKVLRTVQVNSHVRTQWVEEYTYFKYCVLRIRAFFFFSPHLTCILRTSRRLPSWAGSQGPGGLLLSPSLWFLRVCFNHVHVKNKCMTDVCECTTWVFAPFVPLDEADYEEDQDEERDGTHQSYKPALGRDVYMSARNGCKEFQTELMPVQVYTQTSCDEVIFCLFSSCSDKQRL